MPSVKVVVSYVLLTATLCLAGCGTNPPTPAGQPSHIIMVFCVLALCEVTDQEQNEGDTSAEQGESAEVPAPVGL